MLTMGGAGEDCVRFVRQLPGSTLRRRTLLVTSSPDGEMTVISDRCDGVGVTLPTLPIEAAIYKI